MSVHYLHWEAASRHPFVNIADVCRAVRARVQYKAEVKDVWQSPERTWESRRGDCEDFAVLTLELSRNTDFHASLYVCFSPDLGRVGHAFVAGEHPHGYAWVASNGVYRTGWTSIGVLIADMLRCPTRDLRLMMISPQTIKALLAKAQKETKEKRV